MGTRPIIFVCFLLLACSPPNVKEVKGAIKKANLKGIKSEIKKLKYASDLSYTKEKDGYDVHISLPNKTKTLLLRRTPGIKGAIEIPIKSIAILSTSQVGPLVLLGKEQTLKAFSILDFLSSPTLRQLVEQGRVEEVGPFDRLDLERLLKIKPQVLLVDYFPQRAKTALTPLIDAGLMVVEIPSYLEQHPLGRAEWLYLYALLYDEIEKAEALFLSIEKNYLDLVEFISQKKQGEKRRPKILLGLPFKGIWHTPQSNNYLARIVRDAGGVLWNNLPGTGSSALDFEKVLVSGKDADIWLFANNEIKTRKMFGQIDPRYFLFKAFKQNKLYNNNKRMVVKGNDYWEMGILEPNEILADFIQMLHGPQTLSREMKYLLKVK